MILFSACNDYDRIIGKIVLNNVFIGYFTFHRKTGLESVKSVLSLKKSCKNLHIKGSDRIRLKNAINIERNKSKWVLQKRILYWYSMNKYFYSIVKWLLSNLNDNNNTE